MRLNLSMSMTNPVPCGAARLDATGGFDIASGRTMTPDTFTTQPLRSQDQFEAWREWHQPVLDFLPTQSTRYGFHAEVHLWKLGGLAMGWASVPPVSVARTRSNLKRDPIDPWVISYCVRGTHFTNMAGTAVEVPAKVPFLASLGQGFLHERTHIDRVSSSWRATLSEISRLCWMLLAGRCWTRLLGICSATILWLSSATCRT